MNVYLQLAKVRLTHNCCQFSVGSWQLRVESWLLPVACCFGPIYPRWQLIFNLMHINWELVQLLCSTLLMAFWPHFNLHASQTHTKGHADTQDTKEARADTYTNIPTYVEIERNMCGKGKWEGQTAVGSILHVAFDRCEGRTKVGHKDTPLLSSLVSHLPTSFLPNVPGGHFYFLNSALNICLQFRCQFLHQLSVAFLQNLLYPLIVV